VLAILATLGYVLSADRRQVVMIRRDTRMDDIHFGFYNGLGGKLESGEDIVAGMRREIREEAGLECTTVEAAGTISWPGFGRDGVNWFRFLFRIPTWTGTPLAGNPEGSLHWVDIADVHARRVPMWESDHHFLPLVFAEQPVSFHGVMPFENGRATSWSCTLDNGATDGPPSE
jgi:8-oxo-dGTP diphosphatase